MFRKLSDLVGTVGDPVADDVHATLLADVAFIAPEKAAAREVPMLRTDADWDAVLGPARVFVSSQFCTPSCGKSAFEDWLHTPRCESAYEASLLAEDE